jgi:hypothetical protein
MLGGLTVSELAHCLLFALMSSLLAACSPLPDFKINVISIPSNATKLSAIVWRGKTEKLIVTDSQPNIEFDLPPVPASAASTTQNYTFGLKLPDRTDGYIVTVGAFAPNMNQPNLDCLISTASTGDVAGFGVLDSLAAVMPTAPILTDLSDTSYCLDSLIGPTNPVIATATLMSESLEMQGSASPTIAIGGWNFDPQPGLQVMMMQGTASTDITPTTPIKATNASLITFPLTTVSLPTLVAPGTTITVTLIDHADPADPTSPPFTSPTFKADFSGT